MLLHPTQHRHASSSRLVSISQVTCYGHGPSCHSPVPASSKTDGDQGLGSCLSQDVRSRGRRPGSGGTTRMRGPRGGTRTRLGPPEGRIAPRSCTSCRRPSYRCPRVSYRVRTDILSHHTPPRLQRTRILST